LGLCQFPFRNYPDWTPVPVFEVSLDAAPIDRWTEVCSVPEYQQLATYVMNQVASVIPDGKKTLEEIGNTILDYLPYEYQMEITGCAKAIGLPTGMIAIANLGYEISDACTSIVAQTMDNKILHARNLDFGEGMGFTEILRNLTIHVKFTKNGKVAYEAAGFAAFVGILSGFRSKGFSVTVDTRFHKHIQSFFEEIWVAFIERNASMVSLLMRDVFTKESTFEGAVKRLSNTPLIVNVYFIVAGLGLNEGAVVTRNYSQAVDVWRIDIAKGRWFLVETNYDHWLSPPYYDDRVVPANKLISQIGRSAISLPNLRTVLSKKPIKNLMTTYSILSNPSEGYFKVYGRWCEYPCSE